MTQSILNEVSSNIVTPPYEWYDSRENGNISAVFRSRIIKFGSLSTGEREASFRVTFLPQDVVKNGQICWPLDGSFKCNENPNEVEVLARKLILPLHLQDAKTAIWRGRYRNTTTDGYAEFVIDNKYDKDILFVSSAPLRTAGNLYNCDVIITRDFNAVPISRKKMLEMLRN